MSALLGIEILVEEAVVGEEGGRYLWEYATTAAPVSHAYALVAFVVIELILAGLMFRRPALGLRVALAWSVIWLLAMLLDPLTYSYFEDLTSAVMFAQYLYSIWAFDALLIVQIATIVACLKARRRLR